MKVGTKITLVGIASLLLVIAIAYAGQRSVCNDISRVTGLETQYSFHSGCYMKTPEGWRPVK